MKVIFPRHIGIDDKKYLLKCIDNHSKFMVVFNIDSLTQLEKIEIQKKYDKQIIVWNNYIIICSDSNNINDINIILNNFDSDMIIRYFNGQNLNIAEVVIFGILNSYYPIDIYNMLSLPNLDFTQFINTIFKPIIIQLNDFINPKSDLARLLIFYIFNLKSDTTLYIHHHNLS